MRRIALFALLLLAFSACTSVDGGPRRSDRTSGPVPEGPWRWERVPIYEDEELPICERKRNTTPQIRFVRKTKEVEEPIYRNVRVPLTQERCDPCTGEITTVTYGYRNDRVYAGTRKRCVFDGYEPEERPGFCYWTNEVTGTETKPVLKGWRWARVPCPPGGPEARRSSAP